jgi:fumarylacetoacetase
VTGDESFVPPIDHTHDPSATSWIESANAKGHDFPIQNLPFAEFRTKGSSEAFRGGVAIGSDILDLAALHQAGCLSGLAGQAVEACAKPVLNGFFAMGPEAWRALRRGIFALLHRDAPTRDSSSRDASASSASASGAAAIDAVRSALVPQAAAEFAVPASIGDYTDFYTSIHHARNIMKLIIPDGSLTPNFQWVPSAYHGRASSVGVSGQVVRRPRGQVLHAGETVPRFIPTERLDYELELGVFIGTGNALGERIEPSKAEQYAFGICLLNDWSARDIQAWEQTPLGPFQAKNFATTISPWIVTLDALAPYRLPWGREPGEPQPLPHLDAPAIREYGALDIELEVSIETARMRAENRPAARVSRTNFKHQYWTVAQMIAHHTAGGCNLVSGDLIGTGTISGPSAGEAGALIELSFAGQEPVVLDNGETRGFLSDGDAVITTAWCERPGFARIGFGDTYGRVAPAS